MVFPTSKRERKFLWTGQIINAIIFTFIAFTFMDIPETLKNLRWLLGLFFICNIIARSSAGLIEQLFSKADDKQRLKELEHKKLAIDEEIKRIKGEDYNEDAFHNF